MGSLTVDVHQGADVGAADVVVHLAGHGLGEEGVVHLRVVAVLRGLLDDHPPFGPPGGGQGAFGGHRGTPIPIPVPDSRSPFPGGCGEGHRAWCARGTFVKRHEGISNV